MWLSKGDNGEPQGRSGASDLHPKEGGPELLCSDSKAFRAVTKANRVHQENLAILPETEVEIRRATHLIGARAAPPLGSVLHR